MSLPIPPRTGAAASSGPSLPPRAPITSGSTTIPGAPTTGPTDTIETFAQALQKLKSFNEEQSKTPDLSGPIGGLKQVVNRLTNLHTSMQTTLKDILAQINNMKTTNLTASKEQLREYTSSMDKKLNEIQKLLPTDTMKSSAMSGGFQYGSKSKTHKSKTHKSKTHKSKHKKLDKSKRKTRRKH